MKQQEGFPLSLHGIITLLDACPQVQEVNVARQLLVKDLELRDQLTGSLLTLRKRRVDVERMFQGEGRRVAEEGWEPCRLRCTLSGQITRIICMN